MTSIGKLGILQTLLLDGLKTSTPMVLGSNPVKIAPAMRIVNDWCSISGRNIDKVEEVDLKR